MNGVICGVQRLGVWEDAAMLNESWQPRPVEDRACDRTSAARLGWTLRCVTRVAI